MADLVWTAPLGHSIPSHRVHGYCSHCRGRTIAEELAAWQVHEQARYENANEDPSSEDDSAAPVIVDVSSEAADCPKCGQTDALARSTFTATAGDGVHTIGTFAYCFACRTAVDQEVARA